MNATSLNPTFLTLNPVGENTMDYDEFNPNRSAEIAVGAFVALLAIGVIKVIVQSLLD